LPKKFFARDTAASPASPASTALILKWISSCNGQLQLIIQKEY